LCSGGPPLWEAGRALEGLDRALEGLDNPSWPSGPDRAWAQQKLIESGTLQTQQKMGRPESPDTSIEGETSRKNTLDKK